MYYHTDNNVIPWTMPVSITGSKNQMLPCIERQTPKTDGDFIKESTTAITYTHQYL